MSRLKTLILIEMWRRPLWKPVQSCLTIKPRRLSSYRTRMATCTRHQCTAAWLQFSHSKCHGCLVLFSWVYITAFMVIQSHYKCDALVILLFFQISTDIHHSSWQGRESVCFLMAQALLPPSTPSESHKMPRLVRTRTHTNTEAGHGIRHFMWVKWCYPKCF